MHDISDPLTRTILAKIPVGRDNARSVSEIADRADVDDADATEYKTRRIIKTLITEHQRAIASCSEGYFRVKTREELEAYIDDLNSRIAGIQERIDKMKEAFRTTHGRPDENAGQTSLSVDFSRT